jgi:hypothetical protein
MRKSVIMALAAVLVLMLGRGALAELITIQIEAIVDSVVDNGSGTGFLNGQVIVGDTITGYYIYESTTPDSEPSYPTVGRYQHTTSPCGIFLNVGGFEFYTNLSNVDFLLGIADNVTSGGLHDSYWLDSYNNLILSNGSQVANISWSLRDNLATAISDISIPFSAPALADWQANRLVIEGEKDSQGRYFTIDAHVTSATPEPATILLFGLGTLLLRKVR